ncbi:hypothetical protein [uncultured Martelella sp.]|uniref:hypothetical protein n=1 Tax=uncultured Martelella sp. TaxID=392331 RepID=UPI0029C96CEC|nr:hypothetical protein [uncultured Martelella sp.]
MTTQDFPPRGDCRLTSVAGFTSCRCGWSDHPLNVMPCEAAHDAAQDEAIRKAIEGAQDWRPAERLKRGGAPGALADARKKDARFSTTARPEINP